MRAGRGLKAGTPARLFERDQPRRSRPVALAEHQLLRRRVMEVPRTIDDDDDVGDAAGDVVVADVTRHHVDRLDAVLQGDDDRVGADQRAEGGGGRVDVVQLDGEQHDVDRLRSWRRDRSRAGLDRRRLPFGLSISRPWRRSAVS